jgi:hypothetical protein
MARYLQRGRLKWGSNLFHSSTQTKRLSYLEGRTQVYRPESTAKLLKEAEVGHILQWVKEFEQTNSNDAGLKFKVLFRRNPQDPRG